MPVYLAIDGGGTKTEYLLLNEAFEQVDTLLGGGTNHERLPDGYEGVFRELSASISLLLGRNGLTPAAVRDTVAGLSGADNSAQVKALEALLHRLGLASALVCNDGYLPLRAECRTGMAYNCGTGVCCTAIDARGRMTKIGGLDEWSEDAGGGVWLLQQIFKMVYDETVLSLGCTALTPVYADLLGIPQAQLREALDESLQRVKTETGLQRALIAGFFEAYVRRDAAATAIAERMIARAADYLGAAYRASVFDRAPVRIVLAGSILLKAAPAAFIDGLKTAVEQRIGTRAEWIPLTHTPAYGAAQWIRLRAK